MFMISLKDYFDKVWCSCEVWKWSNEKDKNVKLRFSFPCNFTLGDLIKMIISSNVYSFTQGLLMQSLVFLWGARYFRRIFAKNIRRIFGEYSPQIYSRKHYPLSSAVNFALQHNIIKKYLIWPSITTFRKEEEIE